MSSILSDRSVSPEVEVTATAKRRRFTVAEKLRVLKEAAGCAKPGELGALLRREGLYSSHLSAWRQARDRGELGGPARKRGPTPKPVDPLAKRVAELERDLRRATARAERAEGLVELQKKAAEILRLLPDSDERR